MAKKLFDSLEDSPTASSSSEEQVENSEALTAVKTGKKRAVTEVMTATNRAKASLKKPPFQKLWTDDDEISLLQGIVDYKAETDKSPNENPNGFYEFVKDSFSFAASKTQVMEKIRSLKKKYMGKNGKEPKFEKDHHHKVYKLSNHLWGLEGMVSQSILKSNGVSSSLRDKKKLETVKQDLMDNHQSDWFENSFLVKSICAFGVDEHYVKQHWSLVSVEDKKQIEAKLKLLQEKKLDYILETSGFVHEVASMMAKANKKL